MESYGRLLSQHGKSKFYIGIFVVLAAAFLAVAALVAYGILLVQRKELDFAGDIGILYIVVLGLAGAAVLILLTGYFLVRSLPRFTLYETAIRVAGKGLGRTDRYEDIEDLFCYMLGQFCYRPSADVPWIFADGRIGGFARLKETLEDRHAEARGEKLRERVKAGKAAIFHCLPEKIAWSKSLVRNSRNMNFALSTIEVTRHALTIGDRSIPIQEIGDLKTNLWTESARILDRDGNVFFRTHSTAIMSLGALYYLLVAIQEEGAPLASG